MTTPRRSGNYKRSLWDDEYLQSISSVYEGEESIERARELKEEIEGILEEKIMGKDSILGQIEFVDVLQRLGISYHFKGYIHTIMEGLFSAKDGWVSTDLHEVALKFRLLRQHNYLVPQGIYVSYICSIFVSVLWKSGIIKRPFASPFKFIRRWDIDALGHLPDYMKICFFALFNFVNQHSYDVLKTQGFNIVSCLKEVWANLCKAHMVEAKWISSGHTPTIHEFLENGLVTIAGPLVSFYLYICCENPIEEKMLKDFIQVSDLNRCMAIAVRLMDDLGTSPDEMKKGDVMKSIQCYMKEADCSEEEARDHVKYLFHETTKKFNRAMLSNSLISKDVVESFMNAIRTAQCMYHTGDRYGIPDECKELVLSLILESIPLA
ncbi:terpene synthase 10-like [Primulina tabacum]|uniref:terpene synthase 10-like n=1 Tax=Primulina tabacum TaxID=48773 RepID=UPI003F5A0CA9